MPRLLQPLMLILAIYYFRLFRKTNFVEYRPIIFSVHLFVGNISALTGHILTKFSQESCTEYSLAVFMLRHVGVSVLSVRLTFRLRPFLQLKLSFDLWWRSTYNIKSVFTAVEQIRFRAIQSVTVANIQRVLYCPSLWNSKLQGSQTEVTESDSQHKVKDPHNLILLFVLPLHRIAEWMNVPFFLP